MKKVLKLFVIASLCAVNVVSAASSVTIKDLGEKGIQIFPQTDSSSYKIYYQWVKFNEESLKQKKDLDKKIAGLEDDYEDKLHKKDEIQQAKEDLEEAESEKEKLEKEKAEELADYDKEIERAHVQIQEAEEAKQAALSCFNTSGCSTSFTSENEIVGYFDYEISKLDSSIRDNTAKKAAAELEYNNAIDVMEDRIHDYEMIVADEPTILQEIQDLETEIKNLRNQIFDLAKYNEKDWNETNSLVISKPATETAEDYVLWIKLATDEGEIVYASIDSKSLVKKSSTISNNATEESVKNPETSDYVLKFGIVGLISLGVMGLSIKKLKAIKNI